MKIPENDLEVILGLRRSRDTDAARLGAARNSFLDIEDAFRSSIRRASDLEKTKAIVALRDLGLDPDADDYRIMETGVVQIFVDGKFIDAPETGDF